VAITGYCYLEFLYELTQATHDISSDTYKVALLTSSYSPDVSTDALWSAISSNEVSSGNGYTTGGETLTLSISKDTANDRIKITATDTTWATLTKTFRYAVIYRSASGNLVGYINFGSDQSPSAENYTIYWNATGVFDLATT
jgi:hypothetical protein